MNILSILASCMIAGSIACGNIHAEDSALDNNPVPFNTDCGWSLTAEDSARALPLLKERVENGQKLYTAGSYSKDDLKKLQDNLKFAADNTGKVQKGKITFLENVPLHQQSDAAVATLGKEKIDELRKKFTEEAVSVNRRYEAGATPLLDKLIFEAKLRKVIRVANAIRDNKVNTLNDTLLSVSYYLHSKEQLAKLSSAELQNLVELQEELLQKLSKVYAADALVLKEARANLAQLRAVQK